MALDAYWLFYSLNDTKEINPDAAIIMMTGYASVETAVDAVNQGAYAYFVKPVNPDEMKTAIANALKQQRLSLENKTLVESLRQSNRLLSEANEELRNEITEHKGRIYAESELGKGATFVVELPAISEEKEERKPARAEVVEAKEAAGILVVDDEEHIRELLKRTLEQEGYSVTIAADGGSALVRLREQTPGLVLLDIRMSDLTGYQVLERIREQFDVPVIMLTGVLEPTAVEQSVGLGADDYIRKPFNARVLLARIEAKLRRAKQA